MEIKLYRYVFSVFLLFHLHAFSQTDQIKLSGIITVKDGTPIPGVDVSIKGTKNSATTDSCGQFEIYISRNFEGVLVINFSPKTYDMELKKLTNVGSPIICISDIKNISNAFCSKNFKAKKRIKLE